MEIQKKKTRRNTHPSKKESNCSIAKEEKKNGFEFHATYFVRFIQISIEKPHLSFILKRKNTKLYTAHEPFNIMRMSPTASANTVASIGDGLGLGLYR